MTSPPRTLALLNRKEVSEGAAPSFPITIGWEDDYRDKRISEGYHVASILLLQGKISPGRVWESGASPSAKPIAHTFPHTPRPGFAPIPCVLPLAGIREMPDG